MNGGHGMNTKRKRKKNRIMPMACALGIFIGSICNSYMNAYAEALPGLPPGVDLVSAADCMMAYLTSAGMYISNQDWINQLYTSFGGGAGFYLEDLYRNGFLTLDEAGHFVSTGLDTALESQSAWTSLHLDELFNVSAQEAAVGGGVAATGAGTVAGAIGGVATTGALPLAIGVTGAYWGGIAVGTLLAHAVGLYGKPVYYGLEITTDKDFLDGIPTGGGVFTYRAWGQNGGYTAFTTEPGIEGVAVFSKVSNDDVNEGKVYRVGFISNNNLSHVYRYNPANVNQKFETINVQGSATSVTLNTPSYMGYYDGFKLLNNYTGSFPSITDIKSALTNKEYTQKGKYSPDLICSDGNARGEYSEEGGIYLIPNAKPEVNPNGQSIVPGGASLDDWLRWANGVKGNNANNDPDANADIMQQILEAIRNNSPSPGANPNPNPNPTPTPTPVPKPDYDPSQPEQPEYDPKETEGPDNVTDGNPWTTPDLLDRFPFCLPRDVFRCFEKLNVNERMAPSISWHFTTPLGIHFDFDLNLNDYEGIAAILRTLELIAFIIGLALATRNLIGR